MVPAHQLFPGGASEHDLEAGRAVAASPKSPGRHVYAAYVPPPPGGSGELGIASEPRRRASALINAENASGIRRLGSTADGANAHDHILKSADVVGRSVNSFYFRTIAEVCDERSQVPWSAALMASFTLLFLAMQFIALFSVFYMQRLYATFGKQGDQEGTHGEKFDPPYPADIAYALRPMQDHFELLWFYVPTLSFCLISVMSEAENNLHESRAGFLLVNAKWRVLWSLPGRLACAIVLQAFHMAVIIQFFLTTAVVLGTSDGLFNIVLNSVAIVFVLHLDNYVLNSASQTDRATHKLAV